MVDEVEHVHPLPPLPEPLDPSDALLKPGWIPRQINIDQGTQRLQIQTLTRCVGSDHKADRALLDGPLDPLAFYALPFSVDVDSGLSGAGVDCDRFSRQTGRQPLADPTGGVKILTEDDAALLKPLL